MKWKLVIKVWCLDPDLKNSQPALEALFRNIVDSVADLNILDIKDEHDLMVLFPADLMEMGAGEYIYIEVRQPEYRMNNPDRSSLSRTLVTAVRESCRDAKTVECDILD